MTRIDQFFDVLMLSIKYAQFYTRQGRPDAGARRERWAAVDATRLAHEGRRLLAKAGL